MKTSWINKIFQPFEHLTSKNLMSIGLISYILLCFLQYRWHAISDGIIQMHQSSDKTFWKVLLNNGLNSISLTLLLFFLGKILYSKTRFIDVLTVVLVAQCNLLIICLLLFNPLHSELLTQITLKVLEENGPLAHLQTEQLILLAGSGIVALVFVFLFFYLLVQGMKIAINSKKGYHGIIIVLMTLILDAVLWMTKPYFI